MLAIFLAVLLGFAAGLVFPWRVSAAERVSAPEITSAFVGYNGLTAKIWWHATKGPEAEYGVWIFYGPEDGGTNAVAWEQSAYFGPMDAGDGNVRVSGLLPGTQYCWRLMLEGRKSRTWSLALWNTTPELHRLGPVETVGR
jgi:hypothetical protein